MSLADYFRPPMGWSWLISSAVLIAGGDCKPRLKVSADRREDREERPARFSRLEQY